MLQRRSFNRSSRKGSIVVTQAPQQRKQKSVTRCSFEDQSNKPDDEFWFYGNSNKDSKSRTKARGTSTGTESTNKTNKRSTAPCRQRQPLPFLRRPHHEHQTQRQNSHYNLDKKKKKNQMSLADNEDDEDLTDLSTEHFDTDDIYSRDSSSSSQRQQHQFVSPLIRRVAANFENGNANCSSTVTSPPSKRKIVVLANKENTDIRDELVKKNHSFRKKSTGIMAKTEAKKENDTSGEKSDSVKSFKMKTKGSSEKLDIVNKSSVERIKAEDEMMEYNKYCAHLLKNRESVRSTQHLRAATGRNMKHEDDDDDVSSTSSGSTASTANVSSLRKLWVEQSQSQNDNGSTTSIGSLRKKKLWVKHSISQNDDDACAASTGSFRRRAGWTKQSQSQNDDASTTSTGSFRKKAGWGKQSPNDDTSTAVLEKLKEERHARMLRAKELIRRRLEDPSVESAFSPSQRRQLTYQWYLRHEMPTKSEMVKFVKSSTIWSGDICLTEADVDLLPWVHNCSIVHSSPLRSRVPRS